MRGSVSSLGTRRDFVSLAASPAPDILSTILINQLWMQPSDLTGAVRVSLREPAPAYRWRNGSAPYCASTLVAQPPSAALGALYRVLSNATYSYLDGAPLPRRPCAYLDAAGAVPIAESDRAFLVTESRTTAQRLLDARGAACASVAEPDCAYLPPYSSDNGTTTVRSYIPDVEFFTLLVEHSIRAPLAAIEKSVKQMGGELRDAAGDLIDPCDAYTGVGLACPQTAVDASGAVAPGIQVGREGLQDVVSIRTLLAAAGVSSLDLVAGSDNAYAQTSSYRAQGVVLLLEISYSNYRVGKIVPAVGKAPIGGTGSWDNSIVRYSYRVAKVDGTQFQLQTAVDPFETTASRELSRLYGIRILVATSGTIGFSSLQALLVNLVVSLGLLGIGVTVIEFFLFTVCPRRGLYKRLRDTPTVRISELIDASRKSPKEFATLVTSLDAVDEEDAYDAAALNRSVAAFVIRSRAAASPLATSTIQMNPAAAFATAPAAPEPTQAWGEL